MQRWRGILVLNIVLTNCVDSYTLLEKKSHSASADSKPIDTFPLTAACERYYARNGNAASTQHYRYGDAKVDSSFVWNTECIALDLSAGKPNRAPFDSGFTVEISGKGASVAVWFRALDAGFKAVVNTISTPPANLSMDDNIDEADTLSKLFFVSGFDGTNPDTNRQVTAVAVRTVPSLPDEWFEIEFDITLQAKDDARQALMTAHALAKFPNSDVNDD